MTAARRSRTTVAPVPLARLFAIAFRALVEGLHDRLRRRGYRDIGRSYGYVLLALREEPQTVTSVAALLGVTKQAAAKLVSAMLRGGYVESRPDAQDARTKRILISARGRRLLRTVEAIYAELEGEWRSVIGAERMHALRRDLHSVLERTHGGKLPPVRPP